MRKNIIILMSMLLPVFIVGCTDSGGSQTSPTARITAPSDGAAFTVGDEIQFKGECDDEMWDFPKCSSLVWTSDAYGQIGKGQPCATTELSPGSHQITMTGTGSNGIDYTDTVEIIVNPVAVSGSLPDTGQKVSYSQYFGEDSDYGGNPHAYTKLDASGNVLEQGATEWAMVRDEVTGLIWEVKTVDNGIHDKDGTYTWQDAQDVFIEKLNSDNFGGYDDWRLPTIKELAMLMDRDTYDPAIDTDYFPLTVGLKGEWKGYWASNEYPHSANSAWTANFYNGLTKPKKKSDTPYHARAVRGSLAAAELVDNGDGTVTDTSTGLMWEKNIPQDLYYWEDALEYCENLELAGYDDWRMPNINELLSIEDFNAHESAIVSGSWSSTTQPISINHWWRRAYIINHEGSVHYWDSTPPEGDAFFYGYENYVGAVRSIE